MNKIDYMIIGVYLIGLLAMGFVLRKQQSEKDYYLGGRTLGWKPLALSIMATQLSAVSFISAPAFVGLRENGGLIWLSYEIALPLAMLFLLATVLPFLHRAGVVSIYDYLETRFDKTSRLLISFVFQVSRAFATGIMVYAISIILQGTMGLAQWQSVVIIGVVTLIYSLQGGMKAVVYGDAVQMVLIIFGTVICVWAGLNAIGGWQSFINHVDEARLTALNVDSNGFDGQGFGLLPMLFGGFVLYAAYYGCDQSEAQRSLAAKNTSDLKKMILAASLLRFPITLLYCLGGLIIGTWVMMSPEIRAQIPVDKPDWMVPIFIINTLPSGLLGLLIVAILAAAMSSVSSAVNSLSAVSVNDIKRFSGKTLTNQQSLSLARITSFFWGAVTLLLSFFAGDIAPTVIEAINKVGSVFYGPILACFVLGIWAKRVHAFSLNISLLSGVMANIFLWLFAEHVFWFWWNVSGFVLTSTLALIVSTAFPNTKATEQSVAQNKHHGSPIIGLRETILLVGWASIILVLCAVINAISLH